MSNNDLENHDLNVGAKITEYSTLRKLKIIFLNLIQARQFKIQIGHLFQLRRNNSIRRWAILTKNELIFHIFTFKNGFYFNFKAFQNKGFNLPKLYCR